MMTQGELRTGFARLQKHETVAECRELIGIYSNFMMLVIQNHHSESLNSRVEGHGKLILQMMMTKTIAINSLLNGLSFKATDGSKLDKLLDPVIFGVLIRNVYETAAMFNLIYKTPCSPDEKLIMYNLWVIAGLSYRQRFSTDARTEENKKKVQDDKNQIDQLILEIRNTDLYKSLDQKNLQKIENKIKEKDYLMKFKNGQVVYLSWANMLEVFQVAKPGLFENTYTYLSLYAHPSNVSVFQFGEMFSDKNTGSLGMTKLGLVYFFNFLSFFASDFVHVFEYTKRTFDELPILDQILIDFPNKMFRGDDYTINESWKKLG
ncbi:MAG: hypothetical protein ACTHMD_17840 [Flavisolibacter sp.]